MYAIRSYYGVKIDFADSWIHLRKSNTEPIIRIYAEAKSLDEANVLASRMIDEIKAIIWFAIFQIYIDLAQ